MACPTCDHTMQNLGVDRGIVMRQKPQDPMARMFYRKTLFVREAHIDSLKNKRRRIRAWLAAYKSTIKCASCGESHPACLDFHHKDPAKKRFSIGDVYSHGASIAVLIKEIEKCVVLCSNCHRKQHHDEGWAIEPKEHRLTLFDFAEEVVDGL